jgi:hypothetical protein
MEHPIEKLQEFIDLFCYLESVVESDLGWETKYRLVFNQACSGQIREMVALDYYDPDEGYEQDVMAFYRAVRERADEFKRVVELYRRKTDAAAYRYLNS